MNWMRYIIWILSIAQQKKSIGIWYELHREKILSTFKKGRLYLTLITTLKLLQNSPGTNHQVVDVRSIRKIHWMRA